MEAISVVGNMINYLDQINTTNDKNTHTIIYVAIGSACITKTYDVNSQIWKVKEGRDQQSPQFIEDIKNKYPNTNVHIWLIDPAIESPPFMVCDKTSINLNRLADGWNQVDSNMYENISNSIRVYSFKNQITYYNNYLNVSNSSSLSGLVNIGSFLDKLNYYAISNNWFVVVQDYSGGDINRLAYYYDTKPYMNKHRNHIIYGLGARTENACLIDLTKPQYRFRFIDDDKIRVFNPYVVNKFTQTDLEESKELIQEFLTYKQNYMIDNYIRLMRQLKLYLNGDKVILRTVSDLYIDRELYKTISDIICTPSIDSCRYLLDIMKSKLSDEIMRYITYTHESHDIDRIMKYIGDVIESVETEEPYKWYNNMRKVIIA